eukprot:scaffold1554_cov401-Prasinococcus_capsulatus_cf.AAC.23
MVPSTTGGVVKFSDVTGIGAEKRVPSVAGVPLLESAGSFPSVPGRSIRRDCTGTACGRTGSWEGV